MERRDFLKQAAIAGTAVSMGPVLHNPLFALGTKSKVVIANDPQCFASNAAVASRVQDMVDHAIMTLTGKTIKAEAYEALFPAAVTSATKILLYPNRGSGSLSRSLQTVLAAIRTGLTSMLNGTFPAANVTTFSGNTANGPQFSIGTTPFKIMDPFVNCTYFINVPVCWATSGTMAGVTMSLKHMMGAVSGTRGNMHSLFTNATTPSLSILNSQPTFKDKQVLVLMDAIDINYSSGPGSSPNGQAFSVLASKDMVATDYQGMVILKTKGLPAACETAAKTVFDNAAKAPYSLGTSDPANMDVVTISPPNWGTAVIWSGGTAEKLGARAVISRRNGRPLVRFDLKTEGTATLSICTLNGIKIWSSDRLEWNGESASGRTDGSGIFLFMLKTGKETLTGHIVMR